VHPAEVEEATEGGQAAMALLIDVALSVVLSALAPYLVTSIHGDGPLINMLASEVMSLLETTVV